jgi:hypothetical protein
MRFIEALKRNITMARQLNEKTSGLSGLDVLPPRPAHPSRPAPAVDDRPAPASERSAGDQEYIFVGGAGHSGTTLMLALVDTHKEVTSVPVETGVFVRIKDDAALKQAVESWPKKYKLNESARYIAEKTPSHCCHLGRIFKLFPNSRIIMMVRDGRDAAVSELKRLGNFEAAVHSWRIHNNSALRFYSDPRVHVVKYEELVGDLEKTLRGVCKFLDLEFEPAMLNHHQVERRWWDKDIRQPDPNAPLVGDNHKINRNWQINQPIFNASGRWRDAMTDEQKTSFKAMAGPLLVELGYAKDNAW